MDYREKHIPCGHFRSKKEQGRSSFNSCRVAFSSRKIQIIKSMIKAGIYETEEKIKITAERIFSIL